MEIESIFGLPAHPLIVHAALVLLPLATLATLVAALVPRARRVAAPIALGFALVATVAVGFAQGSGEELEHKVKETELVEQHTEAGESVLPWALATLLVAGMVTAADPLRRRFEAPSPRVVSLVLVGVSVLAGIGSTVTLIDVGHSGAKATWDDVVKNPVKSNGGG